jgi:SH3-like domain-containing protein
MRWKIFSIVFLFLLVTFATSSFAQEELFPFVAEVTVKQVNVRAGQSENFEKLTILKKGDLAVVVGRRFSWFKIELPSSAKSYISRQFIMEAENGDGKVIGSRVNVRGGPGLDFTVLNQAQQGQTVKIVEEVGDWYRIEPIDGTFGWIADQFLAFRSSDVNAFREELIAMKRKEFKEVQRQKKLADIKKREEVVIEDNQISIIGILQPNTKAWPDGPQYQLNAKDGRIYFLSGVKEILDDLLSYKITVDGILKEDERSDNGIIQAIRVELVI